MKLAVIGLVTLFACGGAPSKPTTLGAKQSPGADLASSKQQAQTGTPNPRTGTLEPSDRPVVDLDVIRISVVRTAPGADPQLTSVATTDIFNQGVELAKAGEGNKAIATFEQLVLEFPESQFAPIALFNIAAILDGRGDTDATIATLIRLNKTYPQAKKSVDGHLYLIALLTEKERYPQALEQADLFIARTNATYPERLEAQARRGYIMIELGKLDEANAALDQAIATWKLIPRLDDPYFVAMAHYYKADILRRKFLAMPVRLPDDQLRKDLDAKELVASAAYDGYRSALGFRQAYWATASGFQMSQIFVDFWRATVTAPYPKAMSGAARPQYVQEVHERVRQHLEKALEGHKMNVALGEAYGVDSMWSNASKVKATEILKILADESRGNYISPAS